MNIALIYGGISGEHEVSVNSAKGVSTPLRNLGHTLFLLAITRKGRWFLQKTQEIQKEIQTGHPLTIVPGEGIFCKGEQLPLDVAFTVTHGYGGEDGTLQGLCLLANIPLCGCDTLSSAIGMHKDKASKLFSLEGIPTVPTIVLDRQVLQWLEGGRTKPPAWISSQEAYAGKGNRWAEACQKLMQKIGPALFIKPENGGSSLGVAALRFPTGETFKQAVLEAKKHGRQVLVQPLIEPIDELECALLETDEGVMVAGPALVVDPGKETNHFLSYEYKYSQVDSAYLQLPSPYSKKLEDQIRHYAKKAFKAIGGEGYARMDFFVSGEKIYLNEINTSPGMTSRSHFPLLMEHAGYSMEQVLKILIEHALQRQKEGIQDTYRPPEA